MMKRDECLKILARHVTDADIVLPVYSAAFDWIEIRPHPLNYLSHGAMGLASSHALGLALGRDWDVPMPVTAATREVLQSHFGAATIKSNPAEYLQMDFAALMETMALASGMKLESENKNVPTGLED